MNLGLLKLYSCNETPINCQALLLCEWLHVQLVHTLQYPLDIITSNILQALWNFIHSEYQVLVKLIINATYVHEP